MVGEAGWRAGGQLAGPAGQLQRGQAGPPHLADGRGHQVKTMGFLQCCVSKYIGSGSRILAGPIWIRIQGYVINFEKNV